MSIQDRETQALIAANLMRLDSAEPAPSVAERQRMLSLAGTVLSTGTVHTSLQSDAMKTILRVFEARDLATEDRIGNAEARPETPETDALIRQLRNLKLCNLPLVHTALQHSLFYLRDSECPIELRSAAHEVFWSAMRMHNQLRQFGIPLSPRERSPLPLCDDGDEDADLYPLDEQEFDPDDLPRVAQLATYHLCDMAGTE